MFVCFIPFMTLQIQKNICQILYVLNFLFGLTSLFLSRVETATIVVSPA